MNIIRKGKICSIALLLLVARFLSIESSFASGPYCGVYAMYGAASSLGVTPNLSDLISAEFVSSRAGSTDGDLVHAAESLGLHATSLGGLGRKSLQIAQDPLILHVAPRGVNGSYVHWLLFTGVNADGNAVVYDGSGGAVECAIEDILARWDGRAVAVHKNSQPLVNYNSSEYADFAWLMILGIGAAFLAANASDRIARRSGLIDMAMIFAAAALVTFIWCQLTQTSSTAVTIARSGIASGLGLTRYNEVTKSEVVSALNDRKIVVVDCRYQPDFDFSRIPSAISLPVDAGWGLLRDRLDGVAKEARVILYCQSKGCRFSDYVASILVAEGYKNLSIYRNGFQEWEESESVESGSK